MFQPLENKLFLFYYQKIELRHKNTVVRNSYSVIVDSYSNRDHFMASKMTVEAAILA